MLAPISPQRWGYENSALNLRPILEEGSSLAGLKRGQSSLGPFGIPAPPKFLPLICVEELTHRPPFPTYSPLPQIERVPKLFPSREEFPMSNLIRGSHKFLPNSARVNSSLKIKV